MSEHSAERVNRVSKVLIAAVLIGMFSFAVTDFTGLYGLYPLVIFVTTYIVVAAPGFVKQYRIQADVRQLRRELDKNDEAL
jgi:hypothetical protein